MQISEQCQRFPKQICELLIYARTGLEYKKVPDYAYKRRLLPEAAVVHQMTRLLVFRIFKCIFLFIFFPSYMRLVFFLIALAALCDCLDHMPHEGEMLLTVVGYVQVLSRLGSGTYGKVFKVAWGSSVVALKVEKRIKREDERTVRSFSHYGAPDGYTQIIHEYRMMHMMSGTFGFPVVYGADFSGDYKYYLMELLGPSVSSIRSKAPGGRLDDATVAALGIQMLDRLESIHQKGYLMYDIHTGNFLVKSERLYAIDLGMAYPYRKHGKHVRHGTRSFIPQRFKHHGYISRRDAAGLLCSRRDELERFLFVIVKLRLGRLPWSHLTDNRLIAEFKAAASPSKICRGGAEWLIPALEHVYSLGFKQRPDYEYLRRIFKSKIVSA